LCTANHVDEIRLGVAETYDVIVQPRDETAYTSLRSRNPAVAMPAVPWPPRMGMTGAIPPWIHIPVAR
jgi:FtsP/CotA-like multicopper oxidase with cupredoxin domain